MSSAQDTEAVLDQFLESRGHDTETRTWERSYNKLQCPDCGGLHEKSATECGVCGWAPSQP